MGMSTEVAGFVPPDETWKKMKAVWDACKAAGIDAPDEVYDFFGDQDPDPQGQTVEIPKREWKDDDALGVEVVVAEIPPKVKIIRFWNSW